MITIKQEEKLLDRIKSLSEIELSKVMEEIYSYLRKENMEHLLSEESEEMEDQITDLSKEIEDLQRENDSLSNDIEEIRALCEEALDVDEFEEDAFDAVLDIIKSIKQLI